MSINAQSLYSQKREQSHSKSRVLQHSVAFEVEMVQQQALKSTQCHRHSSKSSAVLSKIETV